MNIFVLDKDPKLAAKYHCDKHVVKMILETAQILSSAHHSLGVNDFVKNYLYKNTHTNHPCSVWARESLGNYMWLASLGINLCKEYTIRYKKYHKSQNLIFLLSANLPKNIKNSCITEFAQAMPDIYKNKDVVKAYIDYYIGEKMSILTYKNERPYFLN